MNIENHPADGECIVQCLPVCQSGTPQMGTGRSPKTFSFKMKHHITAWALKLPALTCHINKERVAQQVSILRLELQSAGEPGLPCSKNLNETIETENASCEPPHHPAMGTGIFRWESYSLDLQTSRNRYRSRILAEAHWLPPPARLTTTAFSGHAQMEQMQNMRLVTKPMCGCDHVPRSIHHAGQPLPRSSGLAVEPLTQEVLQERWMEAKTRL